MGLFDVHAHLTNPRILQGLSRVLASAAEAGVTTIISNGLHRDDNEQVLALSREHALIRPALGLYPVDAVLSEMIELQVDYPRDDVVVLPAETHLSWLRDHAREAIAIGEIGLDRYWVPKQLWQRQEAVFVQAVEIAQEAQLPIIIHSRKAERRAFEILTEMGVERVNWHCYSSRLKLAREIAEAGHFLSIPANVRRSETFSKMLQTIPRSKLLLETDCPYLAPVAGGQSEPADVAKTARYASELWNCSEQQALTQLEENFAELFGFMP